MTGIARLSGKTAVVTGGASGIGEAIARQLVDHGMNVVIADIEQAALDRAAAEIGAFGIHADVSSFASVAALASEVERRFGGAHLLCANAGVASTGNVAAMTLSDWKWLLDVNLWGLIHSVKAFLPLLQANEGGGHLAVTASLAGFHTTPGLGGYTVSKFAMVALAETLAAELEEAGSNVGVTLLCPGPVKSRLGASQRNRSFEAAPAALVDRDLEATAQGQLMRWADPQAVAKTLIAAIRSGERYVFTHPEMAALVEERHQRIARAMHRQPDASQ